MESLQKEIEERLARGGGFAVFDFDNTCIAGDIAEAVLAYVCEHRLLKNLELLPEAGQANDYHERVFRAYHSLIRDGDIQSAYLFCARAFAGYMENDVAILVEHTIRSEGTFLGKRTLYDVDIARGLAPRPAVTTLMDSLRANGADMWVVSASPEPIVRTAMKHFGIAGKLIGLRSSVKDGVLQDEIAQPYSIAAGKVECIKTYIGEERSLLGAGDSMNDLPMLEYADIKVVVDRRNALAEVARERGWHLLPEEIR